jgi:hypothetical protein
MKSSARIIKSQRVLATDKTTGKKIEFKIDGVFVFVGLGSQHGFLKK